MADDARTLLGGLGFLLVDAPHDAREASAADRLSPRAAAPRAACGLDVIVEAPQGMSAGEIEAEIEALQTACVIQQSVLRELHLALDRATLGLRESRTRLDLLRDELARRGTSRPS